MERSPAPGTIRFKALGGGQPIVILHGLGNDHRVTETCLEPVFRDRTPWRRVYLDLPGHGESPGEDWIRSNDEMVEAVVRFLDSVLPGKRFALVGHSYGGYIARGVAHRLAERVDGVFLWVPALYPRSERQLPPAVVLRKDPAVLAEASSEEERAFLELHVVQDRAALTAIRKILVPPAQVADEKFLTRVADSKLSANPEAQPCLKPALIICGRQDSVVGYRNTWELLESYPRATLAVLDGAGHALGVTEELALFRALVADWLDRMSSLD